MTNQPSRDTLASTGFDNGSLYDHARPDYPQDALLWFVDQFGLTTKSQVLDLGAGTGIFTRQIQPYVGELTAVEPSASMRAALARGSHEVTIVDGSDVAIPVDARSVDVVFVAQAFHWFDAPRALEEIHRVLRPGGGLGLVWNERDESVDWVAALGAAMQWPQHQPYEVGTDFSDIVATGPFTSLVRTRFAHRQVLTHDALVQRVLTTSYISVMDERTRTALLDDVARVIDGLPDPVVLPYVTDAYAAHAR